MVPGHIAIIGLPEAKCIHEVTGLGLRKQTVFIASKHLLSAMPMLL